MNSDLLILYIDSDFIYPVVSSGHGAYENYSHSDRSQRDYRIWLYFEKDDANDRLIPARRAKSAFQSGQIGYEGGVFDLLDSKKTADVKKMLTRAGIFATLKDFYAADGKRPELDIPTVYIFAQNIPHPVRKEFMAMMEEHSFKTHSYTVTLESLAAHTYDDKAKMGDRMIAYSSSGNDLVESSFLIYDKGGFRADREISVVKDLGVNPMREALVNFVVNTIESKNKFLPTLEEKEREKKYQTINIDSWLEQMPQSSNSFTIAFRYSNYPQSDYPVTIPMEMLRQEENKFIQDIMTKMNVWRNKVVGESNSNIAFTLLLGDIFAEKNFRDRILQSVSRGGDAVYISTNDFDQILATYPDRYPDLKQSLKNYDREIDKINIEGKKTGTIFGIIDKVREFTKVCKKLADDYEAQAKTMGEALKDALDQIDPDLFTADTAAPGSCLSNSNFARAYQILDDVKFPTADSELSLRNDKIRQEAAQMRKTLNDPNTSDLAASINESIDRIDRAIAEMEKQRVRIGEIREKIDKLKDSYPEYHSKINEFTYSSDPLLRVRIIEDIKKRKLTREQLPSTSLSSEFRATLQAHVDTKTSGSLFWKKKEQTLEITFATAEDYYTECETVILVLDRPLVSIHPEDIIHTIEKGFNGAKDISLKLPLRGMDSATILYVYVKPSPSEAININDKFFNIPSITIKLS